MRRFIAGRWPMLLGLLVALVIWRWPVTPAWRLEVNERVVGFSSDGRTVLTLLLAKLGKQPSRLQYRDVFSGQFVSSVELQFDRAKFADGAHLFKDRRALLVSAVRNLIDESPPDYYFIELASGRSRAGPIKLSSSNPDSFSEDGRWQWNLSSAYDFGYSFTAVGIVSTTTGDVVLELSPDTIRYPRFCRFSKDGNRVAVLWVLKDAKSEASQAGQIRVIDVPSGRENRRFELGYGNWQSIRQWTDHSAIVEFKLPGGDKRNSYRCRDFDLSSASTSPAWVEKPLLSRYFTNDLPRGQTWWEDGSGWLAYVSNESISETNWQKTLSRVDSMLGTRLLQFKGDQRMSVRRVDPVSGWTLAQIPSIQFCKWFHFSDDGRWLAIDTRAGIELWDTLPPPRWPWAMGWGLATPFGINFVRQRFRRDAVRPSAGIPPDRVTETPG